MPLKYFRPHVNLKQDVRRSFSEKISVEVDKIPAQLITTVLPPVPANSFQLESDFRHLKNSPDMIYQYLKVRKRKLVVLVLLLVKGQRTSLLLYNSNVIFAFCIV